MRGWGLLYLQVEVYLARRVNLSAGSELVAMTSSILYLMVNGFVMVPNYPQVSEEVRLGPAWH